MTAGNTISPSGNVRIGKMMPIVPINALVRQVQELENIPIRPGQDPTVYLRDVATVKDSSDIPTGYALVNGRRAVYILVTKRADASTLSVVHDVKEALPRMQAVLPDDIKVSFEFDQSPNVTNAVKSLATEGAAGRGPHRADGAGLPPRLAERHRRRAQHPVRPLRRVVALWLTGQTINLMTLGGLALAIGILVDEATVEIENIHHQMEDTGSVALAVRRGNQQTAVPRLLAMLCILAVFIPSFFMQGAAAGAVRAAVAGRRLRDGLLLPALEHVRAGAVGLAAAASSPLPTADGAADAPFDRVRDAYGRAVGAHRPAPMAGRAGLPRRARSAVIFAASAGSSGWRSSRGSTPDGSSSGCGRRRNPDRGDRAAGDRRRWRRSARKWAARTSRSRSATSA